MRIFLLIFLCSLSTILLKGQKIKLKPTKVKINLTEGKSIRGFLFDINEQEVIIIPQKRLLKNALITQNCSLCRTISRQHIWGIQYNKRGGFEPVGLMTSVGLGLVLIGAANNRPNPDGLNGRDIAKIYAALGLTIGGIVDLIRLAIHSSKNKEVDLNFGFPSSLQTKTAINQFNKIRDEQLDILSKIQNNKKRYRKRIKIYTKEKKIIIGYIVGLQNNNIMLCFDKKQLVALRENPSSKLMKIPLEDIFFFEFIGKLVK